MRRVSHADGPWSQLRRRSKVARWMSGSRPSDEDPLPSPGVGSFALFSGAHVEGVLAYMARRTRAPQLAAALTAETFAAALAGRRRFRPELGGAGAWLQ